MILDCAVYDGGRRTDDVPLDQVSEACRRPGAFTWIGLYEPTAEEFDSIQREFELHELAVEDAIHAHQRPKLELYGEMALLVLKTARYVDPDEVVQLGEILIFLGDSYVITVRHGEGSSLGELRDRLESDPELLRRGPGAVLHAIVDQVVDDYGPAIAGLEHDVDEVEDQVFTPAERNPAERIYKLKREVLEFLRAAAPLEGPLESVAEGRSPHVDPESRTYFRDVADHAVRAKDRLEALSDLLTSILDANLAQVSVRQNEDMRKISAWVAIAVVPTMIAGIYGMNFEHMPELDWTFGYPAVLALMVAACSTLYWRLRRAGWL